MDEAVQLHELFGDEQVQLDSVAGGSNNLGVQQPTEWLRVRYLPAGADGNAHGVACEEVCSMSDNDLRFESHLLER